MEAVQGVVDVVPPTGPTRPRLGDGAQLRREAAWGGPDGPSGPRGWVVRAELPAEGLGGSGAGGDMWRWGEAARAGGRQERRGAAHLEARHARGREHADLGTGKGWGSGVGHGH